MGQITGADLLAIRSQAASAKDYAATCHANADRLSQHYLALQVENVKLRAPPSTVPSAPTSLPRSTKSPCG